MKTMKREEDTYKTNDKVPVRDLADTEALRKALGLWPFLTNFAGVLLAICIAFGAVFLVHRQLVAEEAGMLGGGGAVALAVRSESAQAGEEETRQAALTEEELLEVVSCLNRETEVGLHEPQAGQLSMTEALRCGREWLSDFLLPRLGLEGSVPQEYKSNCYLWGRTKDGGGAGNGEDSAHEQLLSYWMLSLNGDDIHADLTLNAVTGQVLSATVRCLYPARFRVEEKQYELVEAYLESFGIEASFTAKSYSDEWLDGRRMGNSEIVAVVETGVSSVAMSSAQEEIESVDYLQLHLYLETVE